VTDLAGSSTSVLIAPCAPDLDGLELQKRIGGVPAGMPLVLITALVSVRP
jgi:hypothetical protein